MTKQETVTIMAMLSAFYAGGKNNPQQQAQAWHMILQKYDFDVAKVAVINFAENDTRDYATFPAVGKIVEAIRNEQVKRSKPIHNIKMAISYGKSYDQLSDECKRLIGRNVYDEWLSMRADEFETKSGMFMEMLRNNDNHNRLTTSG